ncbi:Putative cytochrome P450 [Septoria linicola]|uniref:Cytochrome P450 n=1 Tax=Septoria linicola TaxID=215465 RepID=A0A9Q9EM21_9PEZI|nr:Putative cytochrome P450 [Septoria linicola]
MERLSLFALALLGLLGYGIFRLLSIGKRPKDYPPGPPTLPIIGNIHQMPTKDAHLQFQKWAEEYGDIYSLMLGTQTLIVLSSDEAIKDLMDRKSNNYSDRPELYIGQELCSDNLRVLMMGYSPKWRSMRKMFHHLLNATVAANYVPYQTLENKQMLNDLLDTPHDFPQHIRRYSNALTTSMVFGWRTPTYDHPDIQQLFDGFSEFADINMTGVAALLDAFPIIRKLPDFILPTQKKAKELHKVERELYLKHWLRAKKEIKDGTINHCFCVGMAEAQKKDEFSDARAAYISGTLLEAGSDTTSNTLYAFVQAMLLYPDVQRYAQQQIDAVCGNSRLPSMDDQANLPCAGVMNNVWTINNHPQRAPNPRQFDPNRYKDDNLGLYDSASNPDGSKRDMFTFGAGRRICPGMHAFDITPAKDQNGKPIIPDPDKLTHGFVCMPEEYPATITPRSSERAEIVRQEWAAAAREFLDARTKQWIASRL